MSKQRALIIGAGPAGLTAAYELLRRTPIEPLVLEQDDLVGGISRTVNYKGNRIDIGGHRFFSKSDRVMDWWRSMLPMQGLDASTVTASYQGQRAELAVVADGPDPETVDEVMLVRPRTSRIYYGRRFYDYPISLSGATIRNLGLLRTGKIGLSYLASQLFPTHPETTLEQFFINRFGRELYLTFFKSYTEKVWGVPCDQISAEWGAQRIKGLSVSKAVWNALCKPFRRTDLGQKGVETSLIEQFLYPKYGPGQMWETCADKVRAMGGRVELGRRVERILTHGNRVTGAVVKDLETGRSETICCDYILSTMPVRTLVRALDAPVPDGVRAIADGLRYRDFITVGLLMKELEIGVRRGGGPRYPSDTWIYIQEPDVRLGRLQIFNNWSPYLVADPATVWIGLEYFCNQSDDLWHLSDEEMARFGAQELAKIGMADTSKVLDQTVLRIPKTYPAYFGTYPRFDELRSWIDRFENLLLLGRNGMHRYNNQDHSMLTAMVAVDGLSRGHCDKASLWNVNTEQEYHEEQRHERRAA